MDNILLRPFKTAFDTPPFEQIKNEDYLPAFQEIIKKSEAEVEGIAMNPEPATFINTIEALAYAGEDLETISHIFFNLNSAETNDEIQRIAQKVSPILTEYSSKISQNEKLFERIQKVYEERESYTLNEEQQTLLYETYKGFVRSGALLTPEEKEKLKEINIALSTKQLQFGENTLAATNDYIKHITLKEDLNGIPEAVLSQYAEEAKERGLEGWVVSLHYPSYVPFMTYAENRTLRQELALANGKKAFDGGQFDNQQLIKDIIKLRAQKAQLLGYENFATFVLEERMAKSPKKVQHFLKELLDKATPHALQEIEALKALAKKDGIEVMQSYDHAFYAEKLRKQKYDLNDEELKPYFPLAKVQEAVFELAGKLFGLTFEERKDIPKYHPEVKTYEVQENGLYKAVLYVDYFPRKGKRAGAWMTSYKNQYKKGGKNVRPHISVVCNFNKPHGEIPSLLTFQEVTTLFHEFGHAIHGILANTQYPNISGTSVKWDFVELPSQFLENFCYEADFLRTFAHHYQTGEVLKDEKIQKIEASKNFMQGYQTLRQIGFGLLDIAYHTHSDDIKDIKSFEDQNTQATQLYPLNSETAISPSFSHVFQGGYASGYYSYKWAEVLDADAFAYFKETGLFNPDTIAKYKLLLASGGTKDPMELYKYFRGTEPKIESLLKRAFGS
ncbi:M3 family peptidase [Elizabethkingia argentiflava]|uniref:M3 family peptidase n=1 Tax=Elizabethkingia argenteiflava TaxID=2681556 RepID=A0A845PQE2_9FLAO|nr:M3 family metallopeptidase [Elizabethkingia argenteiflava]NAW50519.1 M3 family peptidase [Elizabethkingia argenteiflava]